MHLKMVNLVGVKVPCSILSFFHYKLFFLFHTLSISVLSWSLSSETVVGLVTRASQKIFCTLGDSPVALTSNLALLVCTALPQKHSFVRGYEEGSTSTSLQTFLDKFSWKPRISLCFITLNHSCLQLIAWITKNFWPLTNFANRLLRRFLNAVVVHLRICF